MQVLLLTLAKLQSIEGAILRLGRQYQFEHGLNLTFHCDTSLNNQTQISLNSDNKCEIQSENHFTQLGSYDNHCIEQSILELYLFPFCQTFISINCNGQFSIFQTFYNPRELEQTYNYDRGTLNRSDLITSLTFSVHEVELLILIVENQQELLDSYRIILTKLDDHDNEYLIQQSNIKTYFSLLSVGRYELFIIGELLYKIQFQTQLISEHFIFSTSEIMDYRNMTFINTIGEQLQAYFILHQGECEIKSIYEHGYETLQLREGIYLIRFETLFIRTHSQLLVIAIMSIQDTVILYPTDLYIINHTSGTTAIEANIWSMYTIRIHRLDESKNEQIEILQSDHREIKYSIQNLRYGRIYKFRIELEMIHINTLDIFSLRISNNATITFACNLQEYSFKRISGKFQFYYANQKLQIQTSTYTTLIFTKRFTDITDDLMLNKVYKIQVSGIFRVTNVRNVNLKVFTYPDIDILTYYDYKQQHTKEFINKRIQFEYDKRYYTYIVATSDEPFYIYISNFQENYFHVPKVMLHLTHLVYLNQMHYNFQIISPSKSLKVTETNDEIITNLAFNQEHSLACLIQYQNQRFIEIKVNELQSIDQGDNYVIYFQYDILLIVLESEIDSVDLKFEITNTDVSVPRLSSNNNSSEQYQFKDDSFTISIINHRYLDLGFFECQKLDCIVTLQSHNQNTQVQFLTCVDAELGLFKVYKHIFICSSLLNKDILHVSGQIAVDKAANYVRCKSVNCLILIVDANGSLNSELASFIKVNQVYRNVSGNEFIFYNNETKIIEIHSDQQWSLYNIEDIKVDNMFELAVGYCYLTFTQDPSYIVIFTYPKMLFQDLRYTFTRQEEFILLDLNKKWFILEFYNSSDIQICVDNQRNRIIGKLVQSIMPVNKTITLIGNGTFKVHYVDSICFLLKDPKLLVLYNKTIKIEIELNNDCQYKFIELELNNQTFKSIPNESYFQIDSQYQLLQKQLQYSVLIKTDEYMYNFTYEAQFQQPEDSAYYNIVYLTFLFSSILILHQIIRLHHQNSIKLKILNQHQ